MGSARATLGAIFFFSGAAGLLYQVAWQRALTLYYGVGAVSITLIVSVYMLGLGVGGLIGGRLTAKGRGTLRTYILVELALGFLGLASLPALATLGEATAGSPPFASFFFIFMFLCAPTALMGMTLPLVVHIFTPLSRDLADSVSFLYFVNTLGAASGAIVGAYGLIGALGLWGASGAAAMINLGLAVAVTAWMARFRGVRGEGDGPLAGQHTARADAPQRPGTNHALSPQGLGPLAYPTVFVTGFVAIAYEIVWFRITGVLVKASAYAFASTLAVYLIGTALGSLWMQRHLRSGRGGDRRRAFFALQGAVALSAGGLIALFYALTRHTAWAALPRASFNVGVHPSLELPGGALLLERMMAAVDVFVWPTFFMLIPTALMGASFPLIAHLAQRRRGDEGQTVGRVYFAGTVGNLLGGLVAGFVLLPRLGTEHTVGVLVAMGLPFAMLALRGCAPTRWGAALLTTALLFWALPGAGELYRVIYPPGPPMHLSEGRSGVVATYVDGERLTTYIDGLAHGGRPGPRFHRQVIEAAALASQPRQVLIIGFGTGSMVEAALALDAVTEITLVELNPTLLTNLRQVPALSALLQNPRVNIIIDDARRLLSAQPRRYDLILMDPLRSTTAYSNNLYSKEFFQLLASRLTHGGVVNVWMDEEEILPRTLASVFPWLTLFDDFAVAALSAPSPHPGRKRRHLAAFPPEAQARIKAAMQPPVEDAEALRARLGEGPINTDLRPRCEYYLSR